MVVWRRYLRSGGCKSCPYSIEDADIYAELKISSQLFGVIQSSSFNSFTFTFMLPESRKCTCTAVVAKMSFFSIEGFFVYVDWETEFNSCYGI